MAHLTHYCTCGKRIHWPKTAKRGDEWTCNRCNTTSILVGPGEGGEIGKVISSKAPKHDDAQQTTASTYQLPTHVSAQQTTASASTCFPGESKVLTPFGYQRIDSLEVGDLVLSWQTATSAPVIRPITKVHTHDCGQIWTIEFHSNKPPLRTTAFHTLLTERGWARVDQIKPSDILIEFNSPILIHKHGIARVVESEEKESVYNLTTAIEHNFIIEGFVAHNFTI